MSALARKLTFVPVAMAISGTVGMQASTPRRQKPNPLKCVAAQVAVSPCSLIHYIDIRAVGARQAVTRQRRFGTNQRVREVYVRLGRTYTCARAGSSIRQENVDADNRFVVSTNSRRKRRAALSPLRLRRNADLFCPR